MSVHVTVLLREAVDSLITDADGCYVDATFGRGGHSQEILSRLGVNAQLIVIDKDLQALEVAAEMAVNEPRMSVKHGGFSQIEEFVKTHTTEEGVQGVLLDLGVSSPQLDEADRGFSFMREGPLDMRMDVTQGQTAAEWLEEAGVEEISRVLKEYGEEKFAWRIANAIVDTRADKPLRTTIQLANLIDETVPFKDKHKHPATRSFQAIRIHVNREMQELERFLDSALNVLAVGGRLVVISFHSLEDRMVKRFVREQEKGVAVPSYIPITADQMHQPTLKNMCKPIRASEEEVERNARSRSAIMRVIERVS
ncbi:MAG: 16S rRNA (cytosine(1402)-N(4))-methyltransferase RsmH [Pseudomonadota bacterium]